MGVMERVLSSVTRLSLELKFHTYCPDQRQEMGRMLDLMQRAMHCLHQRVRTTQKNIGDAMLFHLNPMITKFLRLDDPLRGLCIVMRLSTEVDPQQYVLHWPCIAMSRSDLTPQWCRKILENVENERRYDTSHLQSLLPRNTRGYYPLYGCVEESGSAFEVLSNIFCVYIHWTKLRSLLSLRGL